MFRFENPLYLWLLALIPVLMLFYTVVFYRRKKRLRVLGEEKVIAPLMDGVSGFKRNFKAFLSLLILSSMILGVAQPQFGSKLQKVKRKGVELIIALDISNSMMAEDIKPNRLARAKMAISKLISQLHNDKLGLIVFAGEAYTQLPMTTDYAAAKMFLETISPDIIRQQGTAIGAAIRLASESFETDKNNTKALIVITDGENHEDDAIEAANEAKEKGIVVHTIGMGLEKGAPIPVKNRYGAVDFKKDNQGNIVISKLDETLLKQVAAAGEGLYIRANNANTGLQKLFDEIAKMDKVDLEAKVYTAYDEKFQYAFGAAFLLLLLDMLLSNRRNNRFRFFNQIFE